MSAKYTPGPWGTGVQAMQPVGARDWYAVQHVFGHEPFEGVLEEEWGIYPPPGNAGPVAIASSEANARLIACAPDLLAVAKHAQEWTDPESVLGVRLAEVIAKAEGKS